MVCGFAASRAIWDHSRHCLQPFLTDTDDDVRAAAAAAAGRLAPLGDEVAREESTSLTPCNSPSLEVLGLARGVVQRPGTCQAWITPLLKLLEDDDEA